MCDHEGLQSIHGPDFQGGMLNDRTDRSPASNCAVADIRIAFADQLPSAIVEDYFQKRETWFKQRLNLPNYHTTRDEFDGESHIVLATDGRECLGGLRATVRRPEKASVLPMEANCPRLRLKEVFPELSLDRKPYAELSKLLVKSNRYPLSFQNDIAHRLLKFLLVTNNPEPEVRYAFILAPKPQIRIYSALARSLAVSSETRPVEDSLLPESLWPVRPFSIQACQLN